MSSKTCAFIEDFYQEAIIKEEFFQFLRFQSISTDPAYRTDVRACADWLKDYIETFDMDIDVWETDGHPILFAKDLSAGPDKPTLLLYNHYDVQPVDPLDEWVSHPFEPEVRDGEVFARGAVDNKGQCFYVLQALKALMARDGKLPVNIKWIIEGEEETGSSGLHKLLDEKKATLKADDLVVVDVGIEAADKPAVTLSVRGIITFDVEVHGSKGDLHSGSHGGIVYNPNRALAEILSSLYDNTGAVTVPGFYDGVETLSDEEKNAIAWDFDQDIYEETFGKALGGERAYSPLERNWLRPTLEINGMEGGYSGEGFKTVIPAKAKAKISCRLVPKQDPMKVSERIKKHIEFLCPASVDVSVTCHRGQGGAIRTTPNSKTVQAFRDAYTEVNGTPCSYILSGGSIPVAAELAKTAGSGIVLMGYCLPDDALHAPNEHFGLDRMKKGFLTIVRALEMLGGSSQ